jgi:hypothetical protein
MIVQFRAVVRIGELLLMASARPGNGTKKGTARVSGSRQSAQREAPGRKAAEGLPFHFARSSTLVGSIVEVSAVGRDVAEQFSSTAPRSASGQFEKKCCAKPASVESIVPATRYSMLSVSSF